MFQHRPVPSVFSKDVYAGVCGFCRNQTTCGGRESENEKRYGSKPSNFSKKKRRYDRCDIDSSTATVVGQHLTAHAITVLSHSLAHHHSAKIRSDGWIVSVLTQKLEQQRPGSILTQGEGDAP